MKKGTRGPVTSRTTPESASARNTTAITSSGAPAASTSWGRYWATKPSMASTPTVRVWASSPVRSPVAHSGPRSARRAASRTRSARLVSAEARCAATSPRKTVTARATATAARPRSTGREARRGPRSPGRRRSGPGSEERPARWRGPLPGAPARPPRPGRPARTSRRSAGRRPRLSQYSSRVWGPMR